MELTDLELCKRIAEIEGVDWFTSEGIVSYQNDLGMCREYNPLTDDALCFQLMVKYKVFITWNPHINNNCTAVIDGTSEDMPFSFAVSDVNDANPNKAICLTIIEANK